MPSQRACPRGVQSPRRSVVHSGAAWLLGGELHRKMIHGNGKTTKISSYETYQIAMIQIPPLSFTITRAESSNGWFRFFPVLELQGANNMQTTHGKMVFLRFLPFELTLHASGILSCCVTCRCDRAPQAISRVLLQRK